MAYCRITKTYIQQVLFILVNLNTKGVQIK